jgi:hypothetical protein
MSLGIVTRSWLAPEGFDGRGWTRKQLDDFGALMEAASIKVRGTPRLVTDWVRSRGCCCWYNARASREEITLRDKCRVIFGTRERHWGEDWRVWGKAEEGPSPQRRRLYVARSAALSTAARS